MKNFLNNKRMAVYGVKQIDCIYCPSQMYSFYNFAIYFPLSASGIFSAAIA